MHILILPSWYPANDDDFGGSFFREQAAALAAMGNSVGVLALEAISVTDARAFSALRMHAVRSTESAQACAAGVVNVFRALGLRPVPKAHAINVRALARRWEKLFEYYVKEHGRPDVIHAHAMNPAGVAAARISRRHGIPFVVTEHRPESAFSELESAPLARVLKAAASNANARVAVSPAFAAGLTEAYEGAEWITIPNMLPQQFEQEIISPRRNDVFTFGHVSNLHPYKRVDLLLESFSSAFRNDPTVALRIAGDSSFLAEHKAHARRLGLENVEFVGSIARSQIAEEFSRYDAFVMPSSAESFGVVFWEALACGVPLIATATDGGRYAVQNETGLLVDIDDQEALKTALLQMRAESTLFDSAKLRAISVGKCGQAEFVRNYISLYNAARSEEL